MKEVDIRQCWRSIDSDKFCGYYFKHFGCTLKTYIIFIRQVLLENGVIHTECKYGGPLGRIGPSCVKSRLVSSQCVLFWQCVSRNLQTSSVSIVIFAMPTHCCVPGCNQKGVKSSTYQKYLFLNFRSNLYWERGGFTWSDETKERTGRSREAWKFALCILDEILESHSLDELILWVDVYHQDLLGLFHPQGKEKHQQKGCLCRFPCLWRSTCLHPTLLLKSTSRLQLWKVQMKYFPVQVESTKQTSPTLALRVTWKWIKERKGACDPSKEERALGKITYLGPV